MEDAACMGKDLWEYCSLMGFSLVFSSVVFDQTHKHVIEPFWPY